MRFNKQELIEFASNPDTQFEKEGLLFITEQEGYLFRTNVNYLRWCKFRGNLLFYLKDENSSSKPVGLIVVENCKPVIKPNEEEPDGYPIYLEFEGSEPQRIVARTYQDRLDWYTLLQNAGCAQLNLRIEILTSQIAYASMGNRIERGTPVVAKPQEETATKKEEDLIEIPICESALSCDTLPSDENGRYPNALITVQIRNGIDCCWRQYARTEVVENTSNPQFLCTVCFRSSDYLNAESLIRFTLYNVIEKVSQTSIPLGFAEISLGVIQDATRFRIPFKSSSGDVGFITIASWAPDPEVRPPRSPAKVTDQHFKGHRRSQSLPSKLGVKLFIPNQEKIFEVFTNPRIHTYRLHSGLGGDISVQEVLMESRYCFLIPQQLLSIWIMREKELLQEISGMGELGGEWRRRQIELLDKHLKLLKDYSQAKQVLQQTMKEDGPYFKQSSAKTDDSLEFIPVNLHLQRMWAHNDSLNRKGVLDVVTVGAFTRHAGKQRTGGLIKLLQQIRDSPSKFDDNECKVQIANDAVQAVKQLRREIVEIMSQLLCLAKSKNPKGMMLLCNEMISKTKALLNIWEPRLVEEAFSFIEQHRIIEEPDNMMMPMSPFKKITQQLSALDLKSPELEDFATPVVAPPDLWPKIQRNPTTSRQFGFSSNMRMKSPSMTDINTIFSIQKSMKIYSDQLSARELEAQEATHQSLPASVNFETDMNFRDCHFDDSPKAGQILDDMLVDFGAGCSYNQNSTYNFDIENLLPPPNYSSIIGQSVGFLDTKMMSTSPSANYYRPTEEPEPLDLTQLNIEASVMCLVSKIKFLCGRCGSPAIRLRHPKDGAAKRGGISTQTPDVVANQDQFSPQESNAIDDDAAVGTGNDLDLELAENLKAEEEVQARLKKGNKFTDGLDLSMTTDWVSELRPSMRKLRHAMDGLLKTARLMHSVQRLQQDMKRNSANLDILYRRDVCFSQSLTALISALMAKLWGTNITENYIKVLTDLGPVAYFEGLLSLYGGETDMWGDMSVAIEDLLTVRFTLVRNNIQRDSSSVPMPRVSGVRNALNVSLPVPESVYSILPTREMVTFKVTPVFFNIGINEKATLAEALGYNRDQHRSNWDNFERLKQYHISYRKLNLTTPDTPTKAEQHLPPQAATNFLYLMEEQLRSNVSKNMKILHLAEDICRSMNGLRFSSCKSAKDRTGMAVTLEQCRLLVQEFHLPAKSVPNVLSAMRSEGTRMDNVKKNIGKRKYAFNLPQVYSLPAMYRPPLGSYGKAQT
ncbi:inositol polyphosphate-4-phosphatase type I A [Episyrphus balteatus]|uniref:inositol polyphosphate-4-phosphatase type I A n=1 Tax=Episyrphus balteatus TaxID=286459 RepID=UPI002485515C|nr:inositol polyphosphate-4-phosphatase type I A [Episyrphus balteatus]